MLSQLRVVDLSDERGVVCGWMLAELGAEVIGIEPPGGSRLRQRGPFAGAGRDPESSLHWWAYGRGRQSVCLDLDSEAGRTAARKLALRADVVIESDVPGAMGERGLGYRELASAHPGLIYVSITPFGQIGPKAHWRGTDLTVLAAGGPLWLCGDDDRAPVRVSVPQAFPHAAAEAAAATLVALHERSRSGLGQHIDVSAQQVVTLATQSDSVAELVGEPGASRCAGGSKMGPIVIRLTYPARDGHVSITHVFGSTIGPATARMMQCVCADGFCDPEMRDKDWIGFTELVLSGQETLETYERAKQCVADWTASKTKSELLELAMERDLLIAPISTPRDVAESPQLAARSYFRPLAGSDSTEAPRELGSFARFGAAPRPPTRPAPRLGAHTRPVLEALESLEPPEPRTDRPDPREPAKKASSSGLPLAGLKILDFMWAIAGPMSTRMLADYGATVIRIESTSRADVCRTIRPFAGGAADSENAALFHSCNAGKRMLTLDLTRPETREVVLDLARWADVVCESFTPGTMKKLGFDYASLSEVNPELIMLSTCLMGQTGPLATFAGYGNLAAAIAGFFDLAGWPERAPAGPYGAYTDYIAPKFNAAAILTALDHRRRTGEGQHIDLSQAEAALHFLAPAVLDWTVNGHLATRAGNRDDLFAPHGCYPTAGEDAWIAIAIEDDAAWVALAEQMVPTALASDARFRTRAQRVAHAEALDEIVAAWTAAQDGVALQERLQASGIAAHVVQDSAALAADPQLQALGHFVEVRNGDARTVIEAARSRLSRTPAAVPHTIPTLGRDNHAILDEVLGYDGERIAELVIAGVLD